MSNKVCKDCGVGSGVKPRPAPFQGPRCATHHREEMKRKRYNNRVRRVGVTYNLTPDQYKALVAACVKNKAGDPLCMMCARRRATQVDHDHKCCRGPYSCGKCVRGLLCGTCNNLLGRISDSVEVLQNGVRYLKHPPAATVFLGMD